LHHLYNDMKSDMENRDWINDYELLKQVNTVNPFVVPAGYFDNLEGRITSAVYVAELKNKDVSGGFSVPENYFEELAANIQSRVYLENNLNNGETGFVVPDDYFGDLAEKIQSRIFVEETMGGVANCHAVPEGYFDKLSADILSKTVNVEHIKRKGIVKRLVTSTAFKYATAACFAVAIGGGILLNQLSSPDNEHKNSLLHKQLSTVPVDEIKNYLQLNVDAGETQHMILTQNASIDDNKLNDALQDYVDSVQ